MNFQEINDRLHGQGPEAAVRFALSVADGQAIVSTHFGPYEAAILHLCSRLQPDMPVIWVDSGYNTASTYRFAAQITARLGLQVHIFTPARTRAYRDAVLGGIPDLDDAEALRIFTDEVKLEPFRRALATHKPRVWLTALRKEQTEFRKQLDIVTQDPGGPVKVCPFFESTEADMKAYLAAHDLPDEPDYYDPTKVLSNRECGLHPDFFKKK
jgi:phosphoadenosine phosphosulfate reductase